jgi:ribosomal protein S18 acetylase RimI-like enzyme
MVRDLIIRKTKELDRETVFKFTKNTWGGNDFIQEVWDEWMSDRRGIFQTALLDDRPVGIDKVTVLSPGELWLEGLRVDPKYRGRGIAKALTKRSVQEAIKRGAKIIRLSTGSSNRISRQISEGYGFRYLGGFEHYIARTLHTKPYARKVRQSSRKEVSQVWELFYHSKMYKRTHGLYSSGWTFTKLDRRSYRRLLKTGAIYTAEIGQVTYASIFARKRSQGIPCIAFVAYQSEEYLPRFFQDLRRVAGKMGFKQVWMVLPKKKMLREAAFEGGFKNSYGNFHTIVLERKIKN